MNFCLVDEKSIEESKNLQLENLYFIRNEVCEILKIEICPKNAEKSKIMTKEYLREFFGRFISDFCPWNDLSLNLDFVFLHLSCCFSLKLNKCCHLLVVSMILFI